MQPTLASATVQLGLTEESDMRARQFHEPTGPNGLCRSDVPDRVPGGAGLAGLGFGDLTRQHTRT